MLRHFSRNSFFKFFKLDKNFENFDQKSTKKCQKSDFWQKIMSFYFFFKIFKKYCLIQKFD